MSFGSLESRLATSENSAFLIQYVNDYVTTRWHLWAVSMEKLMIFVRGGGSLYEKKIDEDLKTDIRTNNSVFHRVSSLHAIKRKARFLKDLEAGESFR